MKVFRQLCAITVLTLAFAQAAMAENEGVIHPGIIPPPPPPPPVSQPAPQCLIEPCKELVNEDGTADLLTETTLILVQNLLALF